MKLIQSVVKAVGKQAAKRSANTASNFFVYQPKEPKALKKSSK